MGVAVLAGTRPVPRLGYAVPHGTATNHYTFDISVNLGSQLEKQEKASIGQSIKRSSAPIVGVGLPSNPVAYKSSTQVAVPLGIRAITIYETHRSEVPTHLGITPKGSSSVAIGYDLAQALPSAKVGLAVEGYVALGYLANDTTSLGLKTHLKEWHHLGAWHTISQGIAVNGRDVLPLGLTVDKERDAREASLGFNVNSSFPIGGVVDLAASVGLLFSTKNNIDYQAPQKCSLGLLIPPGIKTNDTVYTNLALAIGAKPMVFAGSLVTVPVRTGYSYVSKHRTRWITLGNTRMALSVNSSQASKFIASVISTNLGVNVYSFNGLGYTSQTAVMLGLTLEGVPSLKCMVPSSAKFTVMAVANPILVRFGSVDDISFSIQPGAKTCFVSQVFTNTGLGIDVSSFYGPELNAWLRQMLTGLWAQNISEEATLLLAGRNKQPALALNFDVGSLFAVGDEVYVAGPDGLYRIAKDLQDQNIVPVVGIDLTELAVEKVKQVRSIYAVEPSRAKVIMNETERIYEQSRGHRFNCSSRHIGKQSMVLLSGFSQLNLVELFMYLRERMIK